MIAEIGIWRNLVAPEAEVRKANLDHACNCLAIADAVGARCAVSYIGSFAPGTDYAPHPRNMGDEAFDACVETVRLVIDRVKPQAREARARDDAVRAPRQRRLLRPR